MHRTPPGRAAAKLQTGTTLDRDARDGFDAIDAIDAIDGIKRAFVHSIACSAERDSSRQRNHKEHPTAMRFLTRWRMSMRSAPRAPSVFRLYPVWRALNVEL